MSPPRAAAPLPTLLCLSSSACLCGRLARLCLASLHALSNVVQPSFPPALAALSPLYQTTELLITLHQLPLHHHGTTLPPPICLPALALPCVAAPYASSQIKFVWHQATNQQCKFSKHLTHNAGCCCLIRSLRRKTLAPALACARSVPLGLAAAAAAKGLRSDSHVQRQAQGHQQVWSVEGSDDCGAVAGSCMHRWVGSPADLSSRDLLGTGIPRSVSLRLQAECFVSMRRQEREGRTGVGCQLDKDGQHRGGDECTIKHSWDADPVLLACSRGAGDSVVGG